MKSTVLCLLVVLCTINATTLNSLFIKVRNAKLSVEKSTGQVNDLRNNIVQKTDFKILEKWLVKIEKLRKDTERIVKAMNKEIDKAKDKNTQQCYNDALNFIINTDYATYTHALLCHESAKSSIKNNLDFINDLVSIGHKLWWDLDNIFPNCYNSTLGPLNTLKLQQCIIDQLKISNNDLNDLNHSVNSAKRIAKTAFDNIIEKSNKCLNDAYSISQSNMTQAKEFFIRCLKSS